jgi:predicted ribosome quality control (RQC) complex YloA/Tae2 family protein
MKFREFILESGRKIVLGKDSLGNDKLVFSAERNDVLLHTAMPGSPFCNIGEKPTKEEINQAAIVCAKFSQDWRDNKKDVIIHMFLKSNTSKPKEMKPGSWVVKKKENIKVKKSDILEFERERDDKK